jgi:hypothetical protein
MSVFYRVLISRKSAAKQIFVRLSRVIRISTSTYALPSLSSFAGASLRFWGWSRIEPVSNYLGTNLPRFKALGHYGWYDSSILNHGLLIVLVFVLFIALPLGTSGSIMMRLPMFIWKTSCEKPLYPPSLIKLYFGPATTFYAAVSILWFIGVFLFLYFFGLNADWLSILIVLLVFLMGVFNFAVPQLAYIRVVSSSEDMFMESIANHFSYAQFSDSSTDGIISGSSNRTLATKMIDNSNIQPLIHLLKHDDWVYPVHQTYIVVGLYLVSSLSGFLGWTQILEFVASHSTK